MTEPGSTTQQVATVSRSRPTALWMDDDVSKLRIVQDRLNLPGWNFHYAPSIADAVSFVEEVGHISVLLLDAIIPIRKLTLGPVSSEILKQLRAAAPEFFKQSSDDIEPRFGDLERGGLLFQKYCRVRSLPVRKTIIISYVPKKRLARLGYTFEWHINKLLLPDSLGSLKTQFVNAMKEEQSQGEQDDGMTG